MTFSEKLKMIENLMQEDTERCLQEISAKKFISSLFYAQLKALVNMFEDALQKKSGQNKQKNDSKSILRPQIVVGFYSLIIMRSSMVNIRNESTSNIASKVDPQADCIYNIKLAIETLSKIYRGLNEEDPTRSIVCALLLKIKGFNNFKMIAKDLNPDYISEETMEMVFDSIKSQCPNFLDLQLKKYKTQWSKYMRFKPISLAYFQQLYGRLVECYTKEDFSAGHDIIPLIEEEAAYLSNRLNLIEQNPQTQKINIEEFTHAISRLYAGLVQKVKLTSISIKKSAKGDRIMLEYDSRQEIHKNYLKIMQNLLRILNRSISSFGLNWLRKIKQLYEFIVTFFVTFEVKGSNFHESIAIKYSQIMQLMIQMLSSYLITFKRGLFSQSKLTQLTFTEQYSLYKLVEALLYNEYPFDEADVVRYQNYQKQRRNHQNKSKQHVIDVVNFNMKSLNVNPHWDTQLIKIIPQLKNSIKFATRLLFQSLYFIQKYFELTQNYSEAPKLMLMLANAKNVVFTSDKSISSLISKIKQIIYPDKPQIKQGIQYFCEQFFSQYKKQTLKNREEQSKNRLNKHPFQLCRTDQVKINSINDVNFDNIIKKTESYDALLEGWDNYESIKDSNKDNEGSDLKESKSHHMYQSVDSEKNEQIFYSINESKHSKMLEAIKAQKAQQEEIKQDENEVILPEF